jgi:WD40 repeat protein
MDTNEKIPYVGPQPFQESERDRFFGREREARELLALAVSEPLVVFYAQSGAGKSSLVNTCLIPDLRRRGFDVFTGRVGGDAPPGIDVDNIFIFNLIRSLTPTEINPALLTTLSLSQYFKELLDNVVTDTVGPADESTSEVHTLIIDQFEEIFTTHQEAWEKREDFFKQLAQAMKDDPYFWVVLVMREDYVAMLDPYAHLLPGRFRMRYYMQRLKTGAALDAVKKPVKNVRPYADGVAEKLVENLARIKVQRPDGEMEIRAGQFVEPVQLQVVCQNLWNNLSEGTEITHKDLERVGDVDQALERYYDDCVSMVAREKNFPERAIREWFEERLITGDKMRNMVLHGRNESGGLDNAVIQALQGKLIHAEIRAGLIWYELSHDRLIEPVRNSNARWFEKHLSLFQRQAGLWAQQGRSEGLLLRGEELQKAEAEAETLSLTKDEQDFLEACRELRKRELRDLRQRRTIFVVAIISVISFFVAAYFAVLANAARVQAQQLQKLAENAAATAREAAATAREAAKAEASAAAEAESARQAAEKAAARALAGSLAAQANSIRNDDHALALLLGVEAYQREQSLLTRTTLFDLLQFTPYKRNFEFSGAVTSAAVTSDGKRIALAGCQSLDPFSSGCTNMITLFNHDLGEPRLLPGDYGPVYSLAFHEYEDGRFLLAAGGCVPEGCSESQGQISLWDVTDDNHIKGLKPIKNHRALVKTIAISPDGTLLASGSYDTTVLLWDLTNLEEPQTVGRRLDHDSFVNDVEFSKDTRYLIAAGDDRAIYVWNVSVLDKIPGASVLNAAHAAPVTSLEFSPQGLKLASAGDDNRIRIWDWNSGSLSPQQEFHILSGHTGYVKSISFNADGTMLASAGFDNRIILWDTATGEQIGPPLDVHTKAINTIAFGEISGGDDSKSYLISVSDDQTAIRWDLSTRSPLSMSQNPAEENDWARITKDPISINDRKFRFEINGQEVVISDVTDRVDTFLKLDDFDNVINVLYHHDGYLITKDSLGNYFRWNIKPADWITSACRAAKRNLTEAEWTNYLPGQLYRKTCPEFE